MRLPTMEDCIRQANEQCARIAQEEKQIQEAEAFEASLPEPPPPVARATEKWQKFGRRSPLA